MRLLLATDGSAYAVRATEFAAKLVEQGAAPEVAVLYVKHMAFPGGGFAWEPGVELAPDYAAIQAQIDQACREAVESAEKRLTAAGAKVSARVQWGRPADVICDVAEKEGYDLVVMGRSGMGHIAGLLLGSVSERVANRCRVPVIIVEKGGHEKRA